MLFTGDLSGALDEEVFGAQGNVSHTLAVYTKTVRTSIV